MAYWSIRRVSNDNGKNALQYVIYPVPGDLPTPPRLQSFNGPDVFFHPSPIDTNILSSPKVLYPHPTHNFNPNTPAPYVQQYQSNNIQHSPPIQYNNNAAYNTNFPVHPQNMHGNIPVSPNFPPINHHYNNFPISPLPQYISHNPNQIPISSPHQNQLSRPQTNLNNKNPYFPPQYQGHSLGFNYNLYRVPTLPRRSKNPTNKQKQIRRTYNNPQGFMFVHELPNGHHRLEVKPNMEPVFPILPQQINKRIEQQFVPRPLPLLEYLGGEHLHFNDDNNHQEKAVTPNKNVHQQLRKVSAFSFVNDNNHQFIPYGGNNGNPYLYNHITTTANHQFPPSFVVGSTPSSITSFTKRNNNNKAVLAQPPVVLNLSTSTTTEDPRFPSSIQDILPPLVEKGKESENDSNFPKKVTSNANNNTTSYVKRRQKDKDRIYYPIRKYRQYFVSRREEEQKRNTNAPYLLNF